MLAGINKSKGTVVSQKLHNWYENIGNIPAIKLQRNPFAVYSLSVFTGTAASETAD